ncbi:hypothetical protein ACFSMW_09505 [Virgibacillus halophilus]|uniref:Uncharacterized protein n=1 Tax=Tigheibacillus halophilus TaxID=361280 RepID=A0ABU5C6B3_9BACI|nr:hypothetical protein [Virgibacillus halophilus]
MKNEEGAYFFRLELIAQISAGNASWQYDKMNLSKYKEIVIFVLGNMGMAVTWMQRTCI